MKIVMLGAPGAGKGTQAKMISAKYGVPHISTGDIFRANIKNGTELGEKAKKYMDQGLLVPDELTLALIMDRFAQDDCKNGYVLDGFPRTIAQAEALTKSLKDNGDALDMAIDVDVPDEDIIERMGGRRACVNCGGTYHILFNPPHRAGFCDLCGGDPLCAAVCPSGALAYEDDGHISMQKRSRYAQQSFAGKLRADSAAEVLPQPSEQQWEAIARLLSEELGQHVAASALNRCSEARRRAAREEGR